MFPSGWQRAVKLTVATGKITGSFSQLPLLITRDNLPDEMCDPSSPNAAQSDGGDIRAAAYSIDDQTPIEVVSFEHDSTTGAQDAEVEIWVTPSAAGGDTEVFLLYNAATTQSQPAVTDPYGRNAVWDQTHTFVAHLGSTSPVDSTGNSTITKVGTPTLVSAGVVNRLQFSNTAGGTATQYLHAPVAEPGSHFTLSAWVDLTSLTALNLFLSLCDSAGPTHWIDTNNGVSHIRGVANATTIVASSAAFPTALTRITLTWDNSVVRLYKNGSQVASAAYSSGYYPTDHIVIAAGTLSGGYAADGIIGGVRFKPFATLADGLVAEYNNQSSPSTFFTTGTPFSLTFVVFSASAADSWAAQVVALVDWIEPVNAGHTFSSVAQVAAAITESVTAGDNTGEAANALLTIQAQATGSDTLASLAQAAAALSAGTAAGESWAAQAQTLASLIENAAASDVVATNALLTLQATLSENTVASAAFAASVIALANITDGASASDIANASGTAQASITEQTTASDGASAVGTSQAGITEQATAADSAGALGTSTASIAEQATASDSANALKTLTGSIDGQTTASDALVAVVTALSAIGEGAKAGDAWSVTANLQAAIDSAVRAGDSWAVVLAQLQAAITEGVLAGALITARASVATALSAAAYAGAAFSARLLGQGYLVAGAITLTAALSGTATLSPALSGTADISPTLSGVATVSPALSGTAEFPPTLSGTVNIKPH